MTKCKSYMDDLIAAVEFIERELESPLSVKEVCEQFSTSPWQFQRIFRAYVGDSIGNYIRGRRLALALKRLQATPDERILDIAITYQFGSHEAFTRAFKAYFGISPTEIKKDPLRRLPMNKPKLDGKKIQHIASGIKKDPEILTIESKKLVGLPVVINSPLGIDSEFDGKMVQHWLEFKKRRSEIKHRIGGVSYGIALSPGEGMGEEKITYLAAAEVTVFEDIPEGLEKIELPSQLYAKFEVKGFTESCHVTTDYIYGIWLPDSEYSRGKGVDFEIFDNQTYTVNDKDSLSYYLLPVQKL